MSTNLETQLIPGPRRTPATPLDDDQILERFGPTMWDAYRHFLMDPTYAAEMAEAANTLAKKTAYWEARREAMRKA